MKKVFAFILFLLTVSNSFSAPYLCGLNGYFYKDKEVCDAMCGDIPCEETDPNPVYSGNCPEGVKGLFFDPITKKTYGIADKIKPKNVIYYRVARGYTSPVYMLKPLKGKVRIVSGFSDNYDRFHSNTWRWVGFSISRNWLLLSDGKWYAAPPPNGQRRTNSTYGPLEPDAVLPKRNYRIIKYSPTCYFNGKNITVDCGKDIVITLPEGLSLVAIADARTVREPIGTNFDDLVINERWRVAEESSVPLTGGFPAATPVGGMRIFWFGEYSNNFKVKDKYITNGYPTGRMRFILSDKKWYTNERTPNDSGQRTGNDGVCKYSSLSTIPAENFKIVEKAEKCYFKGTNDEKDCGKIVDITFPSPDMRLKWWTGIYPVNKCRRWEIGFSLAVVGFNHLGADEKLFNSVRIENEKINSSLTDLLNYFNIEKAWIGALDFEKSTLYNRINKKRYKWWDGSTLSYSNWAVGEPDNHVDNSDIGKVPELGEHRAYLANDGTWGDDGYHLSYGGDHFPYYPEIVEFNGPLDCVSGLVTDPNPIEEIIDDKCGGQTPCFVCGEGLENSAQCDSGSSEVDYRGAEIGIDKYKGQIEVISDGMIDYCYDSVNNLLGCPEYNNPAFLKRMLFVGDDGKYYGFTETSGEGVDGLSIVKLNKTLTDGKITITIPDGVKLVKLTDVETASGMGTDNNKFDINISIKETYVCPLDKVECTASYDEPFCPEGTLNTERDMCQSPPKDITCEGDYVYDEGADLCFLPPQCPEDNSYYNPDTDRCEKPVNNECAAGFTLDEANSVCFKDITCADGGVFNPDRDRCEKAPIYDCPVGYVYSTDYGLCVKYPECSLDGYVYNSDRDRCEKEKEACPAGYTWNESLNKCVETPVCDGIGVLNPDTDKCEIEATPTCPDGWNLDGSTCWKTPDCGSGTYDTTLDMCVADNLGGSCPIDYTWDASLGKCVYTREFCSGGSTYNNSTNRCEMPADNGCPDGSWTVVGGVCQKDPSCATEGAVYNSYRDRCEKPLSSCPAGYVFNEALGFCTQNPCKDGGSINPDTDKCEMPVVTSCPSGWTANGDVCEKDPYCSEGGSYDSLYNVCLITANFDPCPSGSSYSGGRCVAPPYCRYGETYDSSKDKCVKSAYLANCPTGWTANGDVCQKNPTCPSGSSFSVTLDACVYSSDPYCPDGVVVNGECRKSPPSCINNTYTYSDANNRCEKEAGNLCPWGMTYQDGECIGNTWIDSFKTLDNFTIESQDKQYKRLTVLGFSEIYKIYIEHQISDSHCRGQGDPYTVLNSMEPYGPVTEPLCRGEGSNIYFYNQTGPNYNKNDECIKVYSATVCYKNDYDYWKYIFPGSRCDADHPATTKTVVSEYSSVHIGIIPHSNQIWADDGCRADIKIYGCDIGQKLEMKNGSWSCVYCNEGTLGDDGKCHKPRNDSPTCSTGDTLVNGDTCVRPPDCGSGIFVDGNPDYCKYQYQCSGGTYDETSGKCLTPPVCSEGTYNPSTKKCEISRSYYCPSGMSLFVENGTSYCSYDPSCQYSGFTFDYSIDACIKNALSGACPTGYNFSEYLNKCYKSADCGEGSLDIRSDKCEISVTGTCPTGWAKSGSTCQKSPSCDTPGSYDVSNNLCKTDTNLCGLMSLDNTNSVCYEAVNCYGYNLNGSSDKCETPANFTCPVDFNLEGEICWQNVNCSNGGTFDASIPNCVYNTTPDCPAGFEYDGILDKCKKLPECFEGGINGDTDRCELAITLDCPPEYPIIDGTTCQQDPHCDTPGSYDTALNLCDSHTDVCPSATLDTGLDICYDTALCTGGSLDIAIDMCSAGEGSVNCGTYTFDNVNGVCFDGENICGTATYNAETGRCETEITRNCGDLYAWSEPDGVCLADILSCPNSGEFSAVLDQCFLEANHQCPSGDGYSYTWVGDPVFTCETAPNCFNGEYNSDLDRCYNGNNTCPLGDDYSCVPNADDGKNYCSKTLCSDVQDDETYQYLDTLQGENDKQNDGTIDDDGNCIGTLYIFNGADQRCRLPGMQTIGNDCCTDSTIDLTGLISAGSCKPSELVLSSQKYPDETGVGACHEVGTYCAIKFLRTCIQEKKTYCCFNSPLGRIIQEAGREQLEIDWGTPKNPNCRGLTPEEFQKIDLSKVDFSEWIDKYIKPEIENNLDGNIEKITNQIQQDILKTYK